MADNFRVKRFNRKDFKKLDESWQVWFIDNHNLNRYSTYDGWIVRNFPNKGCIKVDFWAGLKHWEGIHIPYNHILAIRKNKVYDHYENIGPLYEFNPEDQLILTKFCDDRNKAYSAKEE